MAGCGSNYPPRPHLSRGVFWAHDRDGAGKTHLQGDADLNDFYSTVIFHSETSPTVISAGGTLSASKLSAWRGRQGGDGLLY